MSGVDEALYRLLCGLFAENRFFHLIGIDVERFNVFKKFTAFKNDRDGPNR